VTRGITFTFGGLRIDGSSRVLDTPGLYAAASWSAGCSIQLSRRYGLGVRPLAGTSAAQLSTSTIEPWN
jgi:hypothetical protein